MQMVGDAGGYSVSQATWADGAHLRTMQQGCASALGDEVRLTNTKTTFGNQLPYAMQNIPNFDVFMKWHIARIGFRNGPVLEHTRLKRSAYVAYGMRQDHGGHLSLAGGYSLFGGITIRAFEPYHEAQFVPGGANTGRVWELPAYQLFNANQEHKAKNLGA